MKVHAALYSFEFPLKEKIKVGSAVLDRRQVGVLKIQKGELVGFGEASPLPGLNQESFADISKLEKFRDFPSLDWAFHAALWNLNDRPQREVSLCGLILQNEKDVLGQVTRFEALGFPCVKLKVGNDLDQDFSKIELILKETKFIKLRLDFNFRVEFKALMDFSMKLKERQPERFDYFEDPIDASQKELITEFKEKTRFEIARDENLSRGRDEVNHYPLDENFVVKPTSLGFDFINKLKRPKGFILSSSFESNLGLFSAGQGAFEWGQQDKVLGLDTGKYFTENVFDMFPRGGRLILPSDQEVRQKLLKLTTSLKPIKEVEL